MKEAFCRVTAAGCPVQALLGREPMTVPVNGVQRNHLPWVVNECIIAESLIDTWLIPTGRLLGSDEERQRRSRMDRSRRMATNKALESRPSSICIRVHVRANSWHDQEAPTPACEATTSPTACAGRRLRRLRSALYFHNSPAMFCKLGSLPRRIRGNHDLPCLAPAG